MTIYKRAKHLKLYADKDKLSKLGYEVRDTYIKKYSKKPLKVGNPKNRMLENVYPRDFFPTLDKILKDNLKPFEPKQQENNLSETINNK